jgi:hypothetical protein
MTYGIEYWVDSSGHRYELTDVHFRTEDLACPLCGEVGWPDEDQD